MQYATKGYTDLLKEHHVKIGMVAQGKAKTTRPYDSCGGVPVADMW